MALIKNHKGMDRFTEMYWHRDQGIEAVSKVSKKELAIHSW